MTGSHPSTDRASEIMGLIKDFGNNRFMTGAAHGEGLREEADIYQSRLEPDMKRLTAAVTALAAECERMQAVVEAAIVWREGYWSDRLIDAVDAYVADTPAPPATTSEEGT